MEKAYAIWRAFQERLLAPAASFILIGCTLVALSEVFRRYVFGLSFEWQQDFVTFVTLSGVSLYYGIAQRHNSHLNVALLTESLETIGPRTRVAADVVRLLAYVFSLVFMVLVLWWAVPEIRDSMEFESRTESLAFLMWPFLAALWIGFASMAITLVFQTYRQFQKLRGRNVLEEPADPEAAGH